MAIVCQTFNLEKMMQDVGAGVKEATKCFEKDEDLYSRRLKLVSERKAEMLEQVLIHPGESKDDIFDELMDGTRKDAEKLAEKFHAIQMP